MITIWVETLLVGFVCFVLWPGVAIPPAHSLGGRSCRMKKKWYGNHTFYILTSCKGANGEHRVDSNPQWVILYLSPIPS